MINKNSKISAVIIAKNEEEKIEDCLKSVGWANEIILVDSGSEDKTCEIAQKHNARIIRSKGGSYSDWRNKGLENSKGTWVLYVDADERVTPLLRNEIIQLINKSINQFNAFAIPRRNIILGREMKHGGWWPDYVKRLFKRDSLEKWIGEVHEEPVFTGSLGHLKNPFIHIKHDNLSDMVVKTNNWSEIEARLLLETGHPKMIWWRFFRVMFGELWLRLIKYQGFLDGPEGVIYAFYQSWSKFVSYAKLWEMQLGNSKIKVEE